MEGSDYKDSFMKMASSAFSASKTGWTRARQVAMIDYYTIDKNFFIRPTHVGFFLILHM